MEQSCPNTPSPRPSTHDNSAFLAIPSQPTLSIFLGNDLQKVPQSNFLSHVWGNGLDSKCMACDQYFQTTTGPPIRTIGFKILKTSQSDSSDITQMPVAPYHIRVFNRHLSCITSKQYNYVPVSHAWREDVATAREGGIADINVARIVYQTTVRSLLAVTKKYGESEIWHDYLSVPQWRREIQQQLLLVIPDIFRFPKTTIIHFDDVKPAHLSDRPENSPYNKLITDFISNN
jgi:hypothetical protein